MSTVNKTLRKQKAISLRIAGKSYGEIKKELGVSSKGTLSYWFKDLKLSSSEKKRLNKNIKIAQKRGLLKFNKERTKNIKEQNKKIFQDGRNTINKLTEHELLLIGTALYWGEGTKANTSSSPETLAFTNSDSQMIKVFMRFLREIFNIKDEKIRAGIHIYKSINISEAKKFWSRITNLPQDRFYIVQQISRASKGKKSIKLLPFGTVVIKVNNRLLFHKMRGMIDGLINS